MEILFNGDNTKKYRLEILYHFFDDDSITSWRCQSLSKFEEFMEECHRGISITDLVEAFNSELAKLNEKAHESKYDSENSTVCLSCGICGDELFVSKFAFGVTERMWEYKNARDKANDGYIMTHLSNNWNFKMEDGIMRIKYWYDPNDNTLPVYKIHTYNDKIILESSRGANGNKSIIRIDKYYIHCEGAKKVS